VNYVNEFPDTIRNEYPETFNELWRSSNHRSLQNLKAAALGSHSD